MSETIKPWLKRALLKVGLGEVAYGTISFGKHCQIRKWYNARETSVSRQVVWGEVSDTEIIVPFQLTPEAVTQFEKDYGIERITKSTRSGVVIIKSYCLVFANIPFPGFENTKEYISLRVEKMEWLGGDDEPIFGDPVPIGNLAVLDTWQSEWNSGRTNTIPDKIREITLLEEQSRPPKGPGSRSNSLRAETPKAVSREVSVRLKPKEKPKLSMTISDFQRKLWGGDPKSLVPLTLWNHVSDSVGSESNPGKACDPPAAILTRRELPRQISPPKQSAGSLGQTAQIAPARIDGATPTPVSEDAAQSRPRPVPAKRLAAVPPEPPREADEWFNTPGNSQDPAPLDNLDHVRAMNIDPNPTIISKPIEPSSTGITPLSDTREILTLNPSESPKKEAAKGELSPKALTKGVEDDLHPIPKTSPNPSEMLSTGEPRFPPLPLRRTSPIFPPRRPKSGKLEPQPQPDKTIQDDTIHPPGAELSTSGRSLPGSYSPLPSSSRTCPPSPAIAVLHEDDGESGEEREQRKGDDEGFLFVQWEPTPQRPRRKSVSTVLDLEIASETPAQFKAETSPKHVLSDQRALSVESISPLSPKSSINSAKNLRTSRSGVSLNRPIILVPNSDPCSQSQSQPRSQSFSNSQSLSQSRPHPGPFSSPIRASRAPSELLSRSSSHGPLKGASGRPSESQDSAAGHRSSSKKSQHPVEAKGHIDHLRSDADALGHSPNSRTPETAGLSLTLNGVKRPAPYPHDPASLPDAKRNRTSRNAPQRVDSSDVKDSPPQSARSLVPTRARSSSSSSIDLLPSWPPSTKNGTSRVAGAGRTYMFQNRKPSAFETRISRTSYPAKPPRATTVKAATMEQRTVPLPSRDSTRRSNVGQTRETAPLTLSVRVPSKHLPSSSTKLVSHVLLSPTHTDALALSSSTPESHKTPPVKHAPKPQGSDIFGPMISTKPFPESTHRSIASNGNPKARGPDTSVASQPTSHLFTSPRRGSHELVATHIPSSNPTVLKRPAMSNEVVAQDIKRRRTMPSLTATHSLSGLSFKSVPIVDLSHMDSHKGKRPVNAEGVVSGPIPTRRKSPPVMDFTRQSLPKGRLTRRPSSGISDRSSRVPTPIATTPLLLNTDDPGDSSLFEDKIGVKHNFNSVAQKGPPSVPDRKGKGRSPNAVTIAEVAPPPRSSRRSAGSRKSDLGKRNAGDESRSFPGKEVRAGLLTWGDCARIIAQVRGYSPPVL